jgi:hypothetical protein
LLFLFMVEVEDWKLRRDIERDLSRKGGERDKGKKSVSEGIWINVVIKSLCINHVHSMILLSLLNFCYISTAFNFLRLIFVGESVGHSYYVLTPILLSRYIFYSIYLESCFFCLYLKPELKKNLPLALHQFFFFYKKCL